MTDADPLRGDPLTIAAKVLGHRVLAETSAEDVEAAVRRRIASALAEQGDDMPDALRQIEATSSTVPVSAIGNGTMNGAHSSPTEAERVGLCGRCVTRAVLVVAVALALVVWARR